MQMLCMRHRITTEGLTNKGAKELKHSSKNLQQQWPRVNHSAHDGYRSQQGDESAVLPLALAYYWYQPQHIKRSVATKQIGVAQLTSSNLVDNSRAIPAASYSSASPAASYSCTQISRSWTTSRNIQMTMFPSRATGMLTRVDICFD
ncbi:ubiquitin carboxyl-terminal hydrolase 13-like [Dorcoceras hygrometricum]|nr:ubiquitin carboxyl-terminal hydrolase 13-like [Dorcoceras hygrometricum]